MKIFFSISFAKLTELKGNRLSLSSFPFFERSESLPLAAPQSLRHNSAWGLSCSQGRLSTSPTSAHANAPTYWTHACMNMHPKTYAYANKHTGFFKNGGLRNRPLLNALPHDSGNGPLAQRSAARALVSHRLWCFSLCTWSIEAIHFSLNSPHLVTWSELGAL